MLEAAAGELTQIESAGASFGMTDLDLLLSSDDEGLLEVVLSLPMQRDIKKVENIEWPSGAKPRTSPGGSKEEGSKIKQTDSDSDERGALSPSSFGSTKENVPEIYNSIPTKCSQKVSGGGKKRKSLQNPVLKTSLE